MKAYVLHGIGDLRYEETERPEPGEQEAVLKVEAAGVCGSDIPRIYKTGAYSYPLIPGHEFSGRVVQIGPGVSGDWLEKRVGVFPLIPCGKCVPCRQGQYEMCRSYGYLGSRCDGGFAEYVRVPVWNLLPLPETVSFEQAAMLEPMAVAVHAMRRCGLCPRQEESRNVFEGMEKRIAICGLGTIGLLLLMFLLERGFRNVYVVGNKEIQKEMAFKLKLPEDHFCDCRRVSEAAWLEEKAGGDGMDVFFECVGKNETIVQAVNATAPGGTVCMVGNPASDMQLPKQIYWKILRNQLTIQGSWNSSYTHSDTDDWHYVLNRLSEGRIKPELLITHRFFKEDLLKGFVLMRDKTEEYRKVMGEWKA